jgi:hypothetical protein
MSALPLSCLIFMLTLGGIFLGTLLRRILPKHHLSEDAQNVVRLGVGLIATIAALVLGLLIAAAKGSFDTQNTQVKQITADLILLDNILAQYGPEAQFANRCVARSVRLRTGSGVRSKLARLLLLKPTPQQRRSIWTFKRCRHKTICNVRCNRERPSSAMISRKPAFCCL